MKSLPLLGSVIVLTVVGALAAGAATFRAELSSQFLVRGEQALLEFVFSEGGEPGSALNVPSVPGLTIRPLGFGAQPRFGANRRSEYVFRYLVTGYEPENYVIPSAELETDDGTLVSEPLKLRIFNETELEWSTVRINERDVRYAAAFRTTDPQPYVNQVLPTELKLYFPADQRVEDWGIPEFERDGVAAWRFQPRPSIGRVNLLASSFYAISYPSTISATRPGPVVLGPATIRLMIVTTSLRNFSSGSVDPHTLNVQPLEFEARPLPAGAPEGFEDAIGNFDLSVTADETEVREGDPVNVSIVVTGSGNLETLNIPKPIETEGWKLYPATSIPRGDERRELSGFAAFRQFMRPLRTQVQIPPFRLVFFDPETEKYETLLSNAIPLTVLPATGPAVAGMSAPAALPIPVEQMSDILGIATAGDALLPIRKTLPAWWWQLIPAAIVVFLLVRIAHYHLAPRLKKDPDEIARRREFRELERAPTDFRGFYRAAGHFVERWLGGSEEEIPREILERRDDSCFRPEASGQQVPKADRQRILRNLRRLTLPLIALLVAFSPPQARADDARDAYEGGRYDEAARLWLESGPYDRLSADTLYNIGNAAYRLGAPGEGALYWRRALARDSAHAEARQNLRFFERKFGSITIKRPDYQYALTKLSLGTWKALLWASGWLMLIALLIFPATRRDSGLRVAAISTLVAAPLMAAAGFAGMYYYPDEAGFAPLAEQAVVVADRAVVRTDASRNAPEVIVAPAGSPCQVLNRSGNWTYVGFTNDTRGWIPTSEIEPLIPNSPPEPPARRDPSDDQKSA